MRHKYAWRLDDFLLQGSDEKVDHKERKKDQRDETHLDLLKLLGLIDHLLDFHQALYKKVVEALQFADFCLQTSHLCLLHSKSAHQSSYLLHKFFNLEALITRAATVA